MSLVIYGDCGRGHDGPHAIISDGHGPVIGYCETCQESFTWPQAVGDA